MVLSQYESDSTKLTKKKVRLSQTDKQGLLEMPDVNSFKNFLDKAINIKWK